MFSNSKEGIIIFVVCVVVLLLIFCTFIITIIYKYQQRQLTYSKEIKEIKATFENTLLLSQLEIQEQTFQHIAREIHDNIGQKLTLAKLYLNTLSFEDVPAVVTKVESSLGLISDAIIDLSDISRSMSTDLIANDGLVKVIEIETVKLQKSGLYKAEFIIEGKEVFMDTSKEVVLFRIIQEALNNIVKHAHAGIITIRLIYSDLFLTLLIQDNGDGFDTNQKAKGAGLLNMQKRASMLNGKTSFKSSEKGTTITIKIPINETIPA